MLKKEIIIRTLLISLLLFVFSMSLLFPAPNGIVIVSEPAATTLSLSNGTGPVSNLLVATITEYSNKIGYYVTVYSANSSSLLGENNSDTLTYTLTYTDHDSGNPFSVPSSATPLEITTLGPKSPATGTVKQLRMNYTIVDNALSVDTYSDTLTFTFIAAL